MAHRRAVILAGGKGTRLMPYTTVLPKPLMPIGDYPILEVIIRQLKFYNFDHITLAVNHQAEIIKAFFGDGSKWGIKIDYSFETVPLSTAAPLCLVPDLPDNFLFMNGDILSDIDYFEFLENHIKSSRALTISAYMRKEITDYGVLDINDDSILTNFREKPTTQYLVSMGIYAVNRSIINFIPKNTRFGLDDLMYELLNKKQTVHVEPYNGYWMDIGRSDDYLAAIEDFDKIKSRLNI